MKMKDVIRQTGLTDRAVRLYVSNGLVEPECNESQNGRKNIDFSEADVQKLCDIALLRKAGFSIAEIKELRLGGDAAKQVIESFKSETEELIIWKQQVLASLEELPSDEEITIDRVCDSLSKAVAGREVPEEDNELTEKQTLEVSIFKRLAVAGLIFSSVVNILLIIYYKVNFRYTTLDLEFMVEIVSDSDNWMFFIIYWLFAIQFAISLTILLLYFRPKFHPLWRWFRMGVAIVLSIALVLSGLLVPLSGLMSVWAPMVYSETEKPSNYLKVDKYVGLNYICKVFPVELPEYEYVKDSDSYMWDTFPETTKYHYRYSDQIDLQYDIYAEWTLSDMAYTHTKEEMLTNPPITVNLARDKGDWRCLYFADYDEENIEDYYYFLIFAYNDELKAVRYIASYCMDAGNGTYKPYYFTLSWE